MSQLAMLTSRLDALADRLGMMGYVLVGACGLLALLVAIDVVSHSDWASLRALVPLIGFSLFSLFLAPLMPYGDALSVIGLVVGVLMAYWLLH